ncbi:ABC transporter permease [Cohnella suwonensis]|uniref:ABC transporter permease n=1 Tax=Cohnella suwonensis TaxID=696072 RepID=A0ABW0LTR7_9BACL
MENRNRWQKWWNYRYLILMLAPGIAFYFIFCYVPMVGAVIAFKRYDYAGGFMGSPWVGLENFRFLFINDQIWNALRNTVLYNLVFIASGLVLQVSAAIAISEVAGKWFKKLSQSAMFLPYFISWVVVGAFVYNLFNPDYGFFNTMRKAFGMDPVDIFDKPMYWVGIIIFFYAWKALGYGMILYLAAIAGIDQEMYEASRIDGANVFQKIWYITLPCLVPTAIILVLLNLGSIFRGDFSMYYQIVGENALVYSHTDVIDTFVTRALLSSREMGMAGAAGLVQSVLCFAIILIANASVRRINRDYSLF